MNPPPIIDATRELEPRSRPIGWDGQSVKQMLEAADQRFAETGHYQGLERLDAHGVRPDRLREALQPAARRACLRPRDGDEHLGLPDRARAR